MPETPVLDARTAVHEVLLVETCIARARIVPGADVGVGVGVEVGTGVGVGVGVGVAVLTQTPPLQICPDGQRSQESSDVYVTGFVTVLHVTPGGLVQLAYLQAKVVLQRPQEVGVGVGVGVGPPPGVGVGVGPPLSQHVPGLQLKLGAH